MQACFRLHAPRGKSLLWSRYGIMGLGAVCHTLNPRLFPDDLDYIINHGAQGQLSISTWIPDSSAIFSIEHPVMLASALHA